MKCTPKVKNPFEIDFEAIHSHLGLSDLEKTLAYGALAGLLREVVLSGCERSSLGEIRGLVWRARCPPRPFTSSVHRARA